MEPGSSPNSRSLAPETPLETVMAPPLQPAVASSHQSSPHSTGHLWAQRVFLVAFVFLCTVLGVILVWLPWADNWANNGLFLGHPKLQAFLGHAFVRGLVSGVGLLDIWIGVQEATHYDEEG